jgi:hypothetical protein
MRAAFVRQLRPISAEITASDAEYRKRSPGYQTRQDFSGTMGLPLVH